MIGLHASRTAKEGAVYHTIPRRLVHHRCAERGSTGPWQPCGVSWLGSAARSCTTLDMWPSSWPRSRCRVGCGERFWVAFGGSPPSPRGPPQC